ncbi:MAG: hypothetical protein U0W24_03075 [Bacteroidales bacterium]
MKLTKFLLALLLVIPLFQACQADITDLEDPRDAIAKTWRATDNSGSAGALGYDVTISKDLNETTQVLFNNFHGLGTVDKLKATLAGSTLTIPNQELDGTYTISGSGVIAGDLKTIEFEYSVDEGDGAYDVVANYGEKIVKKKSVKVTVPAQ